MSARTGYGLDTLRLSLSSAIAEVMFRKVHTVHENEDAGALLCLFSKDEVGIVVDDADHVHGIITKMDLFDHLTQGTPR